MIFYASIPVNVGFDGYFNEDGWSMSLIFVLAGSLYLLSGIDGNGELDIVIYNILQPLCTQQYSRMIISTEENKLLRKVKNYISQIGVYQCFA